MAEIEYEPLPVPTRWPEVPTRVNEALAAIAGAAEGLDGAWKGYAGETEPDNPFVGMVWVNTGLDPEEIMMWDGTAWVKLEADLTGEGVMFKYIYDPDDDGRVIGTPEYDAVHEELVFAF